MPVAVHYQTSWSGASESKKCLIANRTCRYWSISCMPRALWMSRAQLWPCKPSVMVRIFAAALGDAAVEGWGDLAYRLPVDPVVLSEKRS